MIHLLWLLMGVVVLLGAVACVAAIVRVRGRLVRNEMSSLPQELRDATLLFKETLFRVRSPFQLVARPDRGYLVRNGQIVLVELKTRSSHRVYRSDVIQLSAQSLAVQQQLGKRVASFGYVEVRLPGERPTHKMHRVALLPPESVITLMDRRALILSGRVSPQYAESERACSSCAYRRVCDRPSFGRQG